METRIIVAQRVVPKSKQVYCATGVYKSNEISKFRPCQDEPVEHLVSGRAFLAEDEYIRDGHCKVLAF
jgi:hypothetical protein